MRHESVAGLSAIQPEAVCIFNEYPSIVPKCSWNAVNSILVEADPELVFSKQLVADFAVHGLHNSNGKSPTEERANPLSKA